VTRVALWEKVLLSVMLTALAVGLGVRAWRVGVTVDEPSHLLSAHLYWLGQDRLQPRDMPPLIKLWGGWVTRFFHVPVPTDHVSWTTNHEWPISQEMIARMTPDETQQIFFWSRLPMLFFPLATCWLVWYWARQLFSPVVALLLSFAFSLEPTAFAHGAIFKNDLAATLGYALFWYRAWVYWRDPRLINAAWLGGALLIALLAKLSMLILVPCTVLILMMRRSRLAAATLALLIPYVGCLAAYQFETRLLHPADFAVYASDPAFPAPLIAAAHVFRLIPVASAMWDGTLSLIHSNAGDAPIYLLGELHSNGHWAYFLVALAVKVPATLQVLVVAGLAMLGIRALRRRLTTSDVFLIIPPALYIGLASLSSFQYGIRLILPALPFGLLIAGVAVERWIAARRTVLVAALFGFLAFRATIGLRYPMSFFNLWTGGPTHGLEYLADSNIDWGQGLRYLADYVEQMRIPRIRLFYFGNDNPYRFFNPKRLEVLAPPWAPEQARGTRFQPEPGYYAVSATLLPGYFFDQQHRDYFEVFREMEPVGHAGYSIYVYKVP
jgi:hypothetical protein